ncbi:hypothetical protein CAPTEDRAFT_228530, partial [Capitella teleta]
MTSISKEEYLKRYLSGSDVNKKGKKKRKKKPADSFGKSNVKIVDDDVGFDKIDQIVKEEEENDVEDLGLDDDDMGDNAPIVVGRVYKEGEANYQNDKIWKKIVIDDSDSNGDSDQSPVRRKRHDSDQSPPRRGRHDSDSDQSPPRRGRHDSDSDQSPPRKSRHDSDSDQSPPRKRHQSDSDQSPPRRRGHDSDSDQSPPRRKTREKSVPVIKKEKLDIKIKQEKDDRGRSQYTLGGAKAGLQSAKAMKHEAKKLKQKEEDAFAQMDDTILGKGAQTIQRDKSGKKRDMLMEAEMEREKLAKEAAKQAKYKQWGKGLKQAEFQQNALDDALHESSKPLARYKDDQDLDAMLKAQERDGDPMLQFMRKKKAKQKKAKGDPERPRYRGPEGPPNRFGIMPGYRWDGVNRSIGFEAKLFNKRVESSTNKELAYKWSSYDL